MLCSKYNNQGLQLFTSSLFIAGMIGGIIGGFTTRCMLPPNSSVMTRRSWRSECHSWKQNKGCPFTVKRVRAGRWGGGGR